MTSGAVPDPEQVVRDFLGAIKAGDAETASALLAPNAEWVNVSLPTVRGHARIEGLLLGMQRRGIGFDVVFHSVAVNGTTVLTERDDALTWGRFSQRFWVWGRFEVQDGQITLWRDSFDWRDALVALLRGLAGVAIPALNRRWPPRR